MKSCHQVAGAIRYAHEYHLTERAAREVIDHQIDVIESGFHDVCEQARLTEVERRYFWRRQFLNSYALEGYRRRQRPAPASR